MQKFGLKKIVNENKYHGLNEAHTDDREHNESWSLETSNIIGNENDDTAMYGNMLACDGKSVNNDVGDAKNMNTYKISYERSIERADNSRKKTSDFKQYKSKREKIKKKTVTRSYDNKNISRIVLPAVEQGTRPSASDQAESEKYATRSKSCQNHSPYKHQSWFYGFQTKSKTKEKEMDKRRVCESYRLLLLCFRKA